MGNEEESKTLTIDFTGFAKVLPIEKIYNDLLSRGFLQLGSLFEDFLKTIRLALPRMQLDATTQDRFRQIIEEPYFRVPENHRQLPPAQLVGQILEGVRYEPQDSDIWEMFEQLMERGYDDRGSGDAHPAFAGIIKQLSPDEARLTRILAKDTVIIPYSYQKHDRHISVGGLELADCLRDLNLHKPEYAILYLEHLHALGLTIPLIGKPDKVPQTGAYAGFQRYVFEIHANGFGKLFSNATTKRNSK